MRYKSAAAVIAVLAGLGLAVLSAHPVHRERRQAGPDRTPLVRLDLLAAPGAAGSAAVVRDPFHAIGAAPAPAAGKAPVRARRAAAEAPQAAPAAPRFDLDAAYVGFVRGGTGLAAMVVVSGRTYTVTQGEELVPGYRVVRLTEELIEVESSASVRKTFYRQGDRS